jgi:hypothetical protein
MKTNMKFFFIFLIIIFYLHYTNNKKYNELKSYIFSKKEEFKQLQENLLKNENNRTSDDLIYDHFDDVIAVTNDELKEAAQKAHDDKTNDGEGEGEGEGEGDGDVDGDVDIDIDIDRFEDIENFGNFEVAKFEDIKNFGDLIKHAYYNNDPFNHVKNVESFDDVIGVSDSELKIAAQNAHTNVDNDQPISTPQPVLGCMDMTALNYNPSASISDGKCKFT